MSATLWSSMCHCIYTQRKKVITDLRVWKNSTNTHKQQQFYGSLGQKFSEMYAKYGT